MLSSRVAMTKADSGLFIHIPPFFIWVSLSKKWWSQSIFFYIFKNFLLSQSIFPFTKSMSYPSLKVLFPVMYMVCGYSSIIHGSRNPVWGEDFNFYVHELPVQVAYYHLCSFISSNYINVRFSSYLSTVILMFKSFTSSRPRFLFL